ncbi:zinc finger and SCAN domain-containing protein 12-like [Achroia grisella]|uniref:zinc finger and SCAN domain-containing protein 12-like n=1 Tax=Achroia grisella TaxID=688607 RepID=UPI0027D28EDE|nr:zinc finger and SCAN domain-containing protein 12-like [Achroia grisella]
MSILNRKGPVFDPGLCRCCGGLKKCRLLNVEYEWSGQKEVYSDMFVDCFGLLLSHLDGEVTDRLICATCVTRLREACSFRRQVLCCEQKLLQTEIHVHEGESEEKINTETLVKVENNDVNVESMIDDDNDDVPDHIDNDGDSVKSEPQIKPKKSGKLKKKKERIKTKRKSKKSIPMREEQLAREEVLEKIAEMSAKLRKMEEYDEMQPKPKRTIDNDHKSFHNTIAIVENSYVCPFDTSFSDYYCVYCREVFTDPCKLREHTSTHDPTTFKSTVSNKKLPQLDVMKVDCRLCNLHIDNIENLKQHLTTHGINFYAINNEFLCFKLTVNNLTCLECGVSFSFFHALKKHMAEHFGTCICDVCGAHYFEERMLMLHQRSHQRIEENYPCKECGKTFKSKHSRYLHVARMHKKEPAYQCNKCDEILFSYTLRYRHMIEVHGEQRMYPCEHCERAYDSRKSLREHNRRFHLKIFKHQCDLCEKRFYLPSRLKEHIATHTGERNFRCEYCGKSYPRLRGLKVHMQSHSSDKKFKCVMCNASFTQNVNLKNHMKRQHQSLEAEEGYHEVGP